MKKTKSLLLVLFLLSNVVLFSATDRLISRFERARPKLLDAQKYFNVGKYKKAEKTVRVCLKRMPEYSEAHYLLAKIQLKKNKLNEALESSKLAINTYKYRYILYRWYSDKQNKRELLPSSDVIRLRQEKETRIKNIKAKYYFQYGNIFFRLKKYREAHTQYIEAIKINIKYGDAYINLAKLYYMSKQYQKAMDFLHKAEKNGVKANPKFENILKKSLKI